MTTQLEDNQQEEDTMTSQSATTLSQHSPDPFNSQKSYNSIQEHRFRYQNSVDSFNTYNSNCEQQQIQTQELLGAIGQVSPQQFPTSQQFVHNRVLEFVNEEKDTKCNNNSKFFNDERYKQNGGIDTSTTTNQNESKDGSTLCDDDAELAAWLDDSEGLKRLQEKLAQQQQQEYKLQETETTNDCEFQDALDLLSAVGANDAQQQQLTVNVSPIRRNSPSPTIHSPGINMRTSPSPPVSTKSNRTNAHKNHVTQKMATVKTERNEKKVVTMKPVRVRNTPMKKPLQFEKKVKPEKDEIRQFTPPQQQTKSVIIKDEIKDADRDSFGSQNSPVVEQVQTDIAQPAAKQTISNLIMSRNIRPHSPMKDKYDPGKDRKSVFEYFGIITYQRGNEYAAEGHIWKVNCIEVMDNDGIKLMKLTSNCWGTRIESYQQEVLFNAPAENTCLDIQRAKCTCPVSINCKHTCASILTYLDCLENKKEFPTTNTIAHELHQAMQELNSLKITVEEQNSTIHQLNTEKQNWMEQMQTTIKENEEKWVQEKEKLESIVKQNEQKLVDNEQVLKSLTTEKIKLSEQVNNLNTCQKNDRDQIQKLITTVEHLEQEMKKLKQQTVTVKTEVADEEQVSQPLLGDDEEYNEDQNIKTEQDDDEEDEEDNPFASPPQKITLTYEASPSSSDPFASPAHPSKSTPSSFDDEDEMFSSPPQPSSSTPSFLASPAKKRKRSPSVTQENLYDFDYDLFGESPSKKQKVLSRRVHFEM
jgi:hypothetical protein